MMIIYTQALTIAPDNFYASLLPGTGNGTDAGIHTGHGIGCRPRSSRKS